MRPSGPRAQKITLSAREIHILTHISHARSSHQGFTKRARIILWAWLQKTNTSISKMLRLSKTTVILWRGRYAQAAEALYTLQQNHCSDAVLRTKIEELLTDAPRSGNKSRITVEQKIALIGLACEPLPQPGLPFTRWDAELLAAEIIRRGIIGRISPSWVSRLLNQADLKPHHMKYYLNPGVNVNDVDAFQIPAKTICDLYKHAKDLHQQGVHLVCVDECTGIQAIERLAPTLPMKPGQIECQENDYKRHGTCCLIANFEVATGQMIAPTIGPTRTEKNFLAHIQQTIATDPTGSWIFIVDGLNTHMSESLVDIIAETLEINADLGVKGKSGILTSMQSRKKFLETPTHRIRFVYTPTHCSWLNQVELWFSRLRRKLLKRGSFKSIDELTAKMTEFIAYYNRWNAHPYRWTWAGAPLVMA